MIEYKLFKIMETIMFISIGLVLGSFLTLASYRLPLNQDIIIKSSHCVTCGHKLGFKDLLPFLSWLLKNGKCRYCKEKISIRYPVIELIFAFISLSIFSKYGLNIESAMIILIAMTLCIAIITDFEHYIIPDEIQISLGILGILFNIYYDNINFEPLLSGVVAYLVGVTLRKTIYIFKKQDPLGFGDIKLLAVSGLYMSLDKLPVYFLMSGIIGTITAIIWKILDKGKVFPFGPALAVSLFICIVFPNINITFDEFIMKYILKLA